MDGKKDWTRPDVCRLIDRYHLSPSLWDATDKQHWDRETKLKDWNNLADTFDTSVTEVQRKIHNLRNQFMNEEKKEKKENSYKTRWPYFKKMKFIRTKVNAQPSAFQEVDKRLSEKDTDSQSHDVTGAPSDVDYTSNEASNSNDTTTSGKAKRSPIKRLHSSQNHHSTTTPPPPKPTETLQRQQTTGQSYQTQCSSHPATTPDVYDTFSAFLASEMRQLHHESSRTKLKRMVLQCLLQVSEEDDMAGPNQNQDIVYVPVQHQTNDGTTPAGVDLLPNAIGVSFGRLMPPHQ